MMTTDLAGPNRWIARSTLSLLLGVLVGIPGSASSGFAQGSSPIDGARPNAQERASEIVEDRATRQLMSSVRRGRIARVRAALTSGARIDESSEEFVGPSGQTALLAAALQGNARIVRLLLEAGADASIPEKDGFTVWHAAAFQGRAAVLELLDEFQVPGYGPSPVDGFTPLHRAAWGATLRHVDSVAYLIGSGGRSCDVGGPEPDKTPLDMARHERTKALLEACIERATGPSPDPSVSDKTSP